MNCLKDQISFRKKLNALDEEYKYLGDSRLPFFCFWTCGMHEIFGGQTQKYIDRKIVGTSLPTELLSFDISGYSLTNRINVCANAEYLGKHLLNFTVNTPSIVYHFLSSSFGCYGTQADAWQFSLQKKSERKALGVRKTPLQTQDELKSCLELVKHFFFSDPGRPGRKPCHARIQQ